MGRDKTQNSEPEVQGTGCAVARAGAQGQRTVGGMAAAAAAVMAGELANTALVVAQHHGSLEHVPEGGELVATEHALDK